jgi:hypothetical protein
VKKCLSAEEVIQGLMWQNLIQDGTSKKSKKFPVEKETGFICDFVEKRSQCELLWTNDQ